MVKTIFGGRVQERFFKRALLACLALGACGGAFADGYTKMCYKPPASQSDYPWTWAEHWYSDPNGTVLNRMPTLEDSVLLYSSKNIKVPLRVGAGVHAETLNLTFGNKDWGANNPQSFLVEQGGTMTNAGTVVVGGVNNTCNTAGRLVVAGDWNTCSNFVLGQSMNASSLTVTETGHFVNTNTIPVDANDDVSSAFLVGAVAVASSATSVVTNYGEMALFDLHCGSGTTTSRGIFENFGIVRIGRKFTIGRHGYGRFHLHKGGQLLKTYFHSKPVLIGHGAGAVGEVVFDDDVTLDNGDSIQLGNAQSASGSLTVNDARLQVNGDVLLANGPGSRAQLELTGDAVLRLDNNASLNVGRATGSVARVTLRGHAVLDHVPNLRIPREDCATGVVEVLDHAVITNLTQKMIVLAEPRNSHGELIVGDDAYVGPLTNLSVGLIRDVPTAQVTMRGGTIGITGGGGGVWSLFLGNKNQTELKARICGWGRILRTGSSSDMIRMVPYGQIIADGAGEARDLDFHQVRTVGLSSSENHNTTGSNGWYAVSRGRLVYPRIQEINGNSHRVVGDYPNRAEPKLVNSLRVTMDTYPSTAGYHIYAELYAPDRTDVPTGLPVQSKDIVKGVWRLGFSSGDGLPLDPTPVSFSGLTLQIRHDALDIPEDYKMDVWHHDGSSSGGWRRVMPSRPFDAGNALLQTTEKVEASSETWNAGWFAVIARNTSGGIMVIVR